MLNHDLNLHDADVITDDGDVLMLALPSSGDEPNMLTLCLARDAGGERGRVGGRTITLRWDPTADELTDDWVGPAFELLKGELEE